jgi:GAF domain-containing protein
VYRVGREPVGLAFAKGEPLVYPDGPAIDDGIERIPAATMYVPMGGFGVMTVAGNDVGSLDESDVQLASLLTANAAAALERIEEMQGRRKREAELRRRQRSLEALHDATRRLMAAETKADAATVVAETATDVLGYPVNSVRLVSDDGTQLVPAASVGLDEEARSPFHRRWCWPVDDAL